ncbi:MAG: AAA family ATPase [Kistimonas sp.]|nr:AAA family ATPase [Kistimonas sp.]
MKIDKLRLSHFRCFEDFEITFHQQLTVLVARNGAGKSTVLDGVQTALNLFLTRVPKVKGSNPRDTDFQVYPDGHRPPYMRVRCESTDGIIWDRTEKRDQTRKTASQIPEAVGVRQLHEYVDGFIDAHNDNQPYQLPVLIYYGTERAVFDVPQRKRGFGKDFSRLDSYEGSLESRTNFRRFVQYFYVLEDREAKLQKDARSFDIELPELKAIRKAIATLLPEFSNPRGAEPAGIQVDWNKNGVIKQLRIEQLSDGYRTTLAMVMDIASRMAEANPELENPLETEGVVLIDEVDLHLHPGWQQTILLDLMRAFPNVQFIVSTHSAQVISSVKPECLRVIDWQDSKPGLVPIQFSEGAEAQQILQDVLGLESVRVAELDIVKKLNRYQQLIEQDQWNTDEAKKLRSTLDKWGGEHEPELKRLDMDIQMKEWDRKQQ